MAMERHKTGRTERNTDAPNPFKVGQRVELHPACDDWMRGRRFADVVAIMGNLTCLIEFNDGKRKAFDVNDLNPAD